MNTYYHIFFLLLLSFVPALASEPYTPIHSDPVLDLKQVNTH